MIPSQAKNHRVAVAVALVLAAAGWPLAVVLYVDNRQLAEETCTQQNQLRDELNGVLGDFRIPPKFHHIDCE